jgi:phage terminase Nu1 subunit (DNA packaging protein)
MARQKIKYPHYQQYRVDMALDKIQRVITECKERGADTSDMQENWSKLFGAHCDMQINDGGV